MGMGGVIGGIWWREYGGIKWGIYPLPPLRTIKPYILFYLSFHIQKYKQIMKKARVC